MGNEPEIPRTSQVWNVLGFIARIPRGLYFTALAIWALSDRRLWEEYDEDVP